MFMIIFFPFITLIKAQREIILSDNEYYYFTKKAIIIEEQNQKNRSIANPNFSNAISEISKNFIECHKHYQLTESVSNIITYQNYDQNEIYICLVKITTIECTYKIMNYLVNNQLMIFQDRYFIFNQTNCQKLYNFVQNLFILECRNENILEFKLIDLNNQILDILEITSQFNTTFYSLEVNNKLILMENLNILFLYYIIEINSTKFMINQNKFNLSKFDDDRIGEIKSFQIQNDISLRVFCEYKIFDIYQNSGKIELILNDLIGNQQFIGSFNYMSKDYFVVIDQNNQQEITISHNKIFINPNCEKALSINFINENMIIYCPNYLTIYNNDIISIKYELNNASILFLGYLPFLISFKTQGELEFLKINNLPRCITTANQENILIYYVFQFNVIKHPQIIIIKKYSNPQLVVQIIQQEPIFINQDEQYLYYIFSLQQGLPFSVDTKQQQNSSLIIARDKFFIKQYQEMIWGQQAFFIGEGDIKDNRMFVINKETITIFDFNKTITYRIKPSDNYTNYEIIFFTSVQNFVIISYKTIQAFHYNTMIELKWSLRITQNINKIRQSNQILNIQLQECIEILIQLDSLNYQVLNNSLQFGCTYKIQDQYDIRITEQQIDILPYKSNKLRLAFDNIIDFIYFVQPSKFAIFLVIEQKILLKLYDMDLYDLFFLFNFPLYDFTIIQPLKYQVYKEILVIAAKNSNSQQEVLLVYNVLNQLANTLIKVINIDANQYYFSILNINKIISIYNQSLMITFIQTLYLKFTDQLLDINTDFKHEQVSLECKSDIYNFSQDIQFSFVITNFNYNLRIRDIKIPFILQYDKQKQINKLNFENIFGQIDQVYLLRKDKYQKLDPIVLTPFLQCTFYSNQVCYIDRDAILFNSGNQIRVRLPQSCQDILIFIKELSKNQEIFCLQSGISLDYYEINQRNVTLKQKYYLHNQDRQFQNLVFIKNIAIFHSKSTLQYQILLFNEKNFHQFQYLNHVYFSIVQVIYEKNHYVIFCYIYQFNDQIAIVLLNENNSIKESLNIKISQLIFDYHSAYFSSVNSLLILNHTLFEMIFETEIILCFEKQNCFRINLIIDFQKSLVTSHQINFIRYPFNQGQLQYCLANQYNLILALLINEETVIYFYNLNSTKILDSLYQYKGKNITIEYFNETHFIQITNLNSSQQINFILFQGYQIKSNYLFIQSIETILLNNSVSTLKLEFSPDYDENDIIRPSNILKTIICLVNLVLLIIFLKKFKNRSIHHKN